MTSTSTSPEAVAELRSALGVWAAAASGIARQANAAATALVGEAEAEVRARSARKGALEAALRAAKHQERARLAREIQLANSSLESARRALNRATEAARGAQSLQRRIDESTSSRVPSASQALALKLQALFAYKAVSVPSSTNTSPSTGGLASHNDFGVPGIVNVPIEHAHFEDNPIKDRYDRGGADVSDYRWAVETWETVVRPGVLAGKTREDFERRDAELGRHTGYRRTAGVYDMFLGSDPVHFARRSDGTLDVPSGRHRVKIAQHLGLTHLPGRIYD
jgi:hypothetical protein